MRANRRSWEYVRQTLVFRPTRERTGVMFSTSGRSGESYGPKDVLLSLLRTGFLKVVQSIDNFWLSVVKLPRS